MSQDVQDEGLWLIQSVLFTKRGTKNVKTTVSIINHTSSIIGLLCLVYTYLLCVCNILLSYNGVNW